MVIGGSRGWLNEENILAAHILVNFCEDFLVPKTLYVDCSEGNVQDVGNAAGEGFIGRAADQFHDDFSVSRARNEMPVGSVVLGGS